MSSFEKFMNNIKNSDEGFFSTIESYNEYMKNKEKSFNKLFNEINTFNDHPLTREVEPQANGGRKIPAHKLIMR